jgi:arginine/ornithine transport system permease protein
LGRRLGQRGGKRLDLIAGSLELFAAGVWLTLQLTAILIVIAICIALPAALAQWRNVPVVAPVVRAFAYVVCGTPLTVQLLLVYFVLPEIGFIRRSWAWVILRDPWWCAVIAFSLNAAGYWAVLLAGELEAVPKGLVEAAAALGLTPRQRTWLVVIPSVFRRILPQVGSEVVAMLHASALASVVTLQDILGAARTLNARRYLSLEGLLVAAALYMALTFALVGLFALIERRYLAHLRLSR